MKKLIFHYPKIIAVLIVLIYSTSLGFAQSDSGDILPQYLFPYFDSCIIKLKTGELSVAVMNYNTLTEKMTFLHKETYLDLVKPESVDTIFLNKKNFIPVSNAFYEVVLNAPISFYIQHKSDLLSTGRPAALGSTSQTVGITSVSTLVGDKNSYNLKLPENFKVKPYDVYWVKINDEMHRFLNVNQFLRIFKNNDDQIKEFIKNSDLNIQKKEDLLKLAVFCNNLLN